MSNSQIMRPLWSSGDWSVKPGDTRPSCTQHRYPVTIAETAARPEIIDDIPRTLRQRIEEARVEFRLRFHRKFRQRGERSAFRSLN